MTRALSTTHARLMIALFGAVLLALSGSILLVGTAGAQPTVTNTTNRTATPTAHEQIDNQTRLISSSYDEQNGTATLVIESDTTQAVTLSDAGGFRQGGQIDTRTVVIERGERVTVTLPVTKVGSRVGVAIDTKHTLYAEIIRQPEDHLFQGKPSWQDTRISGLSGFFGGLLVTSLVAWHRVRSDRGEVDRVL